VKITYKNKKLEKSLTDDKELIKTYGVLAKKIKERRVDLEQAEQLEVISKMPAWRLHPYSAGRKGEWSVDIFKNWRIIFEIDQDPIPQSEDGGVNLSEVKAIKILSIEDPH
jgi:proteic killer suppression protein